jgi:hypothetical protein
MFVYINVYIPDFLASISAIRLNIHRISFLGLLSIASYDDSDDDEVHDSDNDDDGAFSYILTYS